MIAEEWDRAVLWRFRARWLPDAYMDGDTFSAMTDNGMWARHRVSIRIADLWAPERDEPGGPEATARLAAALGRADAVEWPLRFVSQQRETVVTQVQSFIRYVGDVLVVIDGELIGVRGLL